MDLSTSLLLLGDTSPVPEAAVEGAGTPAFSRLLGVGEIYDKATALTDRHPVR